MTDRPASPHPDPPLPHPELAAIARRLERRGPAAPLPALRHRVLMAVEDVLRSTGSSTSPAWNRDRFGPVAPQAVALALVAASLALLPILAMGLGTVRLDRSPPRMLSFVERTRLAGITIETTATVQKLNASMPVPAGGPRAIDARTFLEQTHHHGDL